MNKPRTLHDTLSAAFNAEAQPRDTRELLAEGVRAKQAGGFRLLGFLASFRLDLVLFVHRYFAATLMASVVLIAGGAWIAISALGSATHGASIMDSASARSVPTQQFCAAAIRWTIAEPFAPSHFVASTIITQKPANASTIAVPKAMPPMDADYSLHLVEARASAIPIPSATHIGTGILPERMDSHDSPSGYSGVTFAISFEQSSIPADPTHPEFASKSANDLNYAVGYRFDRFNEVGVGYARHVYRHIYSKSKAFYVSGGGYTYVTTWHYSDDQIALPGLFYMFHASNVKFFGVNPFTSAFASKPSAGFLWRVSAGLEWNPWDNLNAVVTYSKEQLNSGTYPAPEKSHTFLNFGLAYRW